MHAASRASARRRQLFRALTKDEVGIFIESRCKVYVYDGDKYVAQFALHAAPRELFDVAARHAASRLGEAPLPFFLFFFFLFLLPGLELGSVGRAVGDGQHLMNDRGLHRAALLRLLSHTHTHARTSIRARKPRRGERVSGPIVRGTAIAPVRNARAPSALCLAVHGRVSCSPSTAGT